MEDLYLIIFFLGLFYWNIITSFRIMDELYEIKDSIFFDDKELDKNFDESSYSSSEDDEEKEKDLKDIKDLKDLSSSSSSSNDSDSEELEIDEENLKKFEN